MRKIPRRKLEVSVDQMIGSALRILDDLHLVHQKTAIEELLESKVPGSNLTIAKLINNVFDIIKPLLSIARSAYPQFFAVLDWAQDIVLRLFAN